MAVSMSAAATFHQARSAFTAPATPGDDCNGPDRFDHITYTIETGEMVNYIIGRRVTVDGITVRSPRERMDCSGVIRPWFEIFDDGTSPYGKPWHYQADMEVDEDQWLRRGVVTDRRGND